MTGLCECGCGQRTNIASVDNAQRGSVKGQPFRFCLGHGRRRPPPREWKVEDRGYSTPCWIWAGGINPKTGYGTARTVEKRTVSAHRVVFEQSRGPIPAGSQLDHLCRVRACVNPDHLEAVSAAVNVERGSKTKIKYADRIAIRASTETVAQLAERYGVTTRTIWHYRSAKGA